MSAIEPIVVPRKIWTRAEVERLSLDGLSLELVNGELIDRMGKRPPHVYWKTTLGNWLRQQFGEDHVRTEDPIDVAPEDNPTSEPEPDISVTYSSMQQTGGRNPSPEELRLVVEISDATYRYDLEVKGALYARAGIQEYWVVDVRAADAPRLIVHRKPQRGKYSKSVYQQDETVTVLDGFTLSLQNLRRG